MKMNRKVFVNFICLRFFGCGAAFGAASVPVRGIPPIDWRGKESPNEEKKWKNLVLKVYGKWQQNLLVNLCLQLAQHTTHNNFNLFTCHFSHCPINHTASCVLGTTITTTALKTYFPFGIGKRTGGWEWERPGGAAWNGVEHQFRRIAQLEWRVVI